MQRENGAEGRDWGPGTRAVWVGEGPLDVSAAAVLPIVRSVTFEYEDLDSWQAVATGRRAGHVYSRNTNPTVAAFEAKVRGLEGGEAATSFATGMAAISNTLLALLSPGERVVSVKDSYGGTNKLFIESLPRFGIEVELCDTADHDAILASVGRGCRLVYLESPTNPTLKVLDLETIAAAAHEAGAVVVVDNTFASPINQRPLELGADLVLHSATKFLGGHSDALGGVACGSGTLVGRVFGFREIHGASL
ncbi:MAG TPA: aminotransferase class I/II-fold pyridoxal phosphate-dependent enzyme, partial [Gemmatimonadota bacterium]|nr:aminotransferase class I/II-fold pyridoxal phosphate-dependent enzyme [Gemmatimonadota bacterium]